MKAQKILVLSETITGGEWIATHRLVSAFKKLNPNHSFYLIGISDTHKLPLTDFSRSIYIDRSTALKPFSFLKKLLKDFILLRGEVKKWDKKVDFVLATNYLGVLAAKSLNLKSTRIIFLFHGIKSVPIKNFSIPDYRQWIIKTLETVSLSLADAIIAPSDHAIKFIKGKLRFSKNKKIFLVPNIVPDIFFKKEKSGKLDNFKKSLGINRNTHIVLYSGRIAEYKGLENLARAITEIRNRRKDITLILTYPSLNVNPNIFSLFENISDYLILIPDAAENTLRKLYQIADIAILPSELEFAPLSLIEAFASTTPAIATNKGNAGELLKMIDSNLILENNSPEEIVKKLNYFFALTNKKILSMKKKSKKVAEDFMEEKAVIKFTQVLHSL